MRMLVTGCYGFIGARFCALAADAGHSVVGLSRDTDQRNRRRLESSPGIRVIHADLARDDVSGVCEGADAVVHFAAKTFVDHSIRDLQPFAMSNVLGTCALIEDAVRNGVGRWVQVSTDEVYGQCLGEPHHEGSPLDPRNPYAATKAAADLIAMSYCRSGKLPVIVTRTENNYGPMQHPQKVIPAWTRRILAGEPVLVYGDGRHTRRWLHVDDHCRGVLTALHNGKVGEIYHVAASQEIENNELAARIGGILGRRVAYQYIDDSKIRPGHDRRYAISADKIAALGWAPQYTLDSGLEDAVSWYSENEWWFA